MQFLAPTKVILLNFSVIDLEAIEATQNYKGIMGMWRDLVPPAAVAADCVLWLLARGRKWGEENGQTKEQRNGHCWEADFMPAAEAAENVRRKLIL